MDDLKIIIAKNIQELRQAHNMTQAELAEQLNYSDKAVSKWERGESVPDIVVLKQIADMFSVTLDYLANPEHEQKPELRKAIGRRIRNHGFITGMSMVLVVLLATLAFAVCDIVIHGEPMRWLAFVYAVPVAMIVWLVFNSMWFNKRRNFLIISLLMWTTLATVFLTVMPWYIFWQIFLLGVPAQIIILLWSKLRYKK